MTDQSNDHDLLVRLDEKMRSLLDELRILRDANDKRITKLEVAKLDQKDFDTYRTEHEKDMEKVFKNIDSSLGGISSRLGETEAETKKHALWIAGCAAVLGTLQFIAPIITKYIFQ